MPCPTVGAPQGVGDTRGHLQLTTLQPQTADSVFVLRAQGEQGGFASSGHRGEFSKGHCVNKASQIQVSALINGASSPEQAMVLTREITEQPEPPLLLFITSVGDDPSLAIRTSICCGAH